MKGMVFTEFLELVADRFGDDMVDDIIDDAEPASGGAYTAVGTYHHSEMVKLVTALSARSGLAVPELLQLYGRHLFAHFNAQYPLFFEGKTSTTDFLASVNDHIHVEVRKLYPEAELPSIRTELIAENHIELHYKSSRPFADFAHGLILGCIAFFEDGLTVERISCNESNSEAVFKVAG